MTPQIGDQIYVGEDRRKIQWMGNTTFEWNYGWANLNEIVPNPNYPKTSTIKWTLLWN